MRQLDPDWPDEGKYYVDADLRKMPMFSHIPKRLYPPHGGIAKHWRDEPDRWKWIGWRQWHCDLYGLVSDQKFENGWIIGVLRVSQTRNAGEVIVLLNDDKWIPVQANSAPNCKAIPRAP